ncbi:hypothetical protein SDC9_169346 [bioreactor metagenome]|uniref:Uncharacterized protein n=1 Tax=bioreactor metagenome TaxID=1076179 RepID=A0A645GD72_9ZZZZ
MGFAWRIAAHGPFLLDDAVRHVQHHDDLLCIVRQSNALGIIELDHSPGRRGKAIRTFLHAVNRHRGIAKGNLETIAKVDRGLLGVGRLRRAVLRRLAGRYCDKSCQY